MAKTKFCAGLSDISDTYMGFIIDDWGVLHDGEDAFPHTVDCLKELKERKKHIIILANDRKRKDEKKVQLKKMGIGPSLYHEIVTPATVIYDEFEDRDRAPFDTLGKKAYVITRKGDVSILGLIGTNFLVGPSLLARRYEDAGGIVHYIGKPHNYIFKYCIDLLKDKEVYPSHTVMLGDTMAHDVLGANSVGIDTCLFKSGLHAANFMGCTSLKEVDNTLKNLIAQYNNVMPNYLVDEMQWGNALPDRKHKKRKQPA